MEEEVTINPRALSSAQSFCALLYRKGSHLPTDILLPLLSALEMSGFLPEAQVWVERVERMGGEVPLSVLAGNQDAAVPEVGSGPLLASG